MVFEKLKGIIIDHIDVEEYYIIPEASFVDDLGCDSLDLVELELAVEDEFDISFPDSEAEKITTVGDAVVYIQEHM